MTGRTEPKRLLTLHLDDKKQFLESFDYVLTDCDGVLWNLCGPFEGAGPAISALKSAGKRVVYVSNNSVRTLDGYKQQVRKLGLEFEEKDLINPALSVVRYLKLIDFQGLIYAICAEPLLRTLTNAGFRVISGPNEPQPESLRLVIPVIHDKQPVKAVIIDSDFNCNHIKLVRAEMYLRADPDCLLIAGATSSRVSLTPQLNVLGLGYYTEMLQKSTGKEAVVLGKPGYQLGEQIKQQFGITQANRVLVVGDTIAQDVAFGRMAGFQTLLVLTGGTTMNDLNTLSDGHAPDFYTESFADLKQLTNEVL